MEFNVKKKIPLISGTCLLVVFLCACGQKKTSLPVFNDFTLSVLASYKDMPETIPAYGIAMGPKRDRIFEMNIEASDSSRIKVGQKAVAFFSRKNKQIRCRVTQVFLLVSKETGQAVARLRPNHPTSVKNGEFLYAEISVSKIKNALTVPLESVLIKNGNSYVVVKSSGMASAQSSYFLSKVQTGVEDGKDIQILSGIKAGEQIVTQGAIGFLYPHFKAEAD